jgi:hypothetical protein
MPRVLVTTDDRNHAIVLDEPVCSDGLCEGRAADALIERLAWGIDDAEQAESAFRFRDVLTGRPTAGEEARERARARHLAPH